MRRPTLNIALLATLGASMGVIEAQFGTILHSASVPFAGAVMIFFSVLFFAVGKQATAIRLSSLAMVLNAALIKFLFVGGVAIYPVVGMSLQAALFDLIVHKHNPQLKAIVAASVLMQVYSLFHPLLTHGLLGGKKMLFAYHLILSKAGTIFGIENDPGLVVLLMIVFLHFAMGVITGVVGYHFLSLFINRGLIRRTSLSVASFEKQV